MRGSFIACAALLAICLSIGADERITRPSADGFGDETVTLAITRHNEAGATDRVPVGQKLALTATATGIQDQGTANHSGETAHIAIFMNDVNGQAIANGTSSPLEHAPYGDTLAPGTYNFIARITPSRTRTSDNTIVYGEPKWSAWKQVVVVAVDKIIVDGSSPENQGPITIAVKEKIKLKAIPDPSGSFPSNHPVRSFAKDGNGNDRVPSGSSAVISASGDTATLRPDKAGEYVVKATCGTSKEFTIQVVDPMIKSIAFAAETGSIYAVRMDDNSADYPSPHWEDNTVPLDGDADDHPGDKKSPVCFLRDSRMSITATFSMRADLTPTDTMKVRASSSGFNFPATALDRATLSTTVIADAKFINKVDFFDTLDVKWELSLDDGTTWIPAGTTENQVYVVLGAPQTTVFHTLAHVGCKNAKGKDTTSDVSTGVWGAFLGRSIKRVAPPGGNELALKYYGAIDCTNITTAQLLAHGDGQCGAWAKFFLDMLKVQGITYQNAYVFIEPKGLAGEEGFIVKNWNFAEGNGKSGVANFPFLNLMSNPFIAGNNYQWRFAEVTPQNGIQGQGPTDNPASRFTNHVQVLIDGLYYDPSYGQTFTSLANVDDLAMDGYWVSGMLDIDEPTVDLDLNGNNNKLDMAVPTTGVMVLKKNAPGNDLKETKVTY